ncbi:hypothetical protein V3C99_011941 [Haemonchus contortus]
MIISLSGEAVLQTSRNVRLFSISTCLPCSIDMVLSREETMGKHAFLQSWKRRSVLEVTRTHDFPISQRW